MANPQATLPWATAGRSCLRSRARRHVGAAALRAARAARAWPAVVRAVEVAAYGVTYTLMVAAVTAVVTLAMTLVEAEREGSVC